MGYIRAITHLGVSNYSYIVSWAISPIYRTYPTYVYRGYNPFTKYHGHPSIVGEFVTGQPPG